MRWKTMALLLAALVLYLVGNEAVALWDRDEPRYAQASRQMLQSGDWVVPRLYDQVRSAKPVLIYWCQAGCMALLGDNAFAARLPSALAMVGTLGAVFFFLRKETDQPRALWAAFVLGTSVLAIAAAKMCLTDSVLLLWTTLGQICLYAFLSGRGTWPMVVLYGVATGLAGLTKGPVVLGVQAMTLLAYGVLSWGRLGGVRRINYAKIAAAIALILAVALPWVVWVEIRYPSFIHSAIRNDALAHVRSGMEGHKGPPGYYLLTVWGTFFPWSLLLPATMVLAWRHRAERLTRFALAAVIGPWIMVEIFQTKLPHYLLPVFPALAYLTAEALVRGNDLVKQRRHRAIAVAFVAVVLVLYGVVLPHIDAIRIPPRLGEKMRALGAVDAVMMDYKEPSLAFYQGGTLREKRDDFLTKTPVADWPEWAVMTKEVWDRLPEDAREHLEIVDQEKGLNYAGKMQRVEVILARKK